MLPNFWVVYIPFQIVFPLILSYCGKKEVAYLTQQDSINIRVRVGSQGFTGEGFNITVTPQYTCGGIISSDTIIQSPDYPSPYPAFTTCLWDIKVSCKFCISIELLHLEFWPKFYL